MQAAVDGLGKALRFALFRCLLQLGCVERYLSGAETFHCHRCEKHTYAPIWSVGKQPQSSDSRSVLAGLWSRIFGRLLVVGSESAGMS